MSKPKYWPTNLKWDDSYVIIHELESYPPIYVLSTGTKIRGELPLSEYKRVTYIHPQVKSKKSIKCKKCKKCEKMKRKSKKKSKRKSRKYKRKSKRS